MVTKSDDSDGTNVATGRIARVGERCSCTMIAFGRSCARKNSFMEVGCDVGHLLKVAQTDSFAQIYGCEPNPLARERASNC